MNMTTKQSFSLGIVGGRGYVGKALLQLLTEHPCIAVSWISSRTLAGSKANSLVDGLPPLIIENLNPEQVAERNTDIIVLALPNGLAAPYVEALQSNDAVKVILDLSADYRYDPAWFYSVPELDKPTSHSLAPNKLSKISNPGCYATAMQLALAPIIDLLEGRAHCFGVSGYSGAGTTPSPNNDPENLRDNLLPYGLIEHGHEKEVSARLQTPVSFTPHVASFFRGINMTIQVEFTSPQSAVGLFNLYNDFYALHPLVLVKKTTPSLKQVTNSANCVIGGFSLSEDGKRATMVSCLDNLLKGAASQALQNINLALGLNSTLGLGDIL